MFHSFHFLFFTNPATAQVGHRPRQLCVLLRRFGSWFFFTDSTGGPWAGRICVSCRRWRGQCRDIRRQRRVGAGGGARLGRAVLFSWFLFRRFFAQRVGGFFLTRRHRHHVDADHSRDLLVGQAEQIARVIGIDVVAV